jgi:hypothetical protein
MDFELLRSEPKRNVKTMHLFLKFKLDKTKISDLSPVCPFMGREQSSKKNMNVLVTYCVSGGLLG